MSYLIKPLTFVETPSLTVGLPPRPAWIRYARAPFTVRLRTEADSHLLLRLSFSLT